MRRRSGPRRSWRSGPSPCRCRPRCRGTSPVVSRRLATCNRRRRGSSSALSPTAGWRRRSTGSASPWPRGRPDRRSAAGTLCRSLLLRSVLLLVEGLGEVAIHLDEVVGDGGDDLLDVLHVLGHLLTLLVPLVREVPDVTVQVVVSG